MFWLQNLSETESIAGFAKVDFSNLGYYDLVFTSPPYEYLEVYESMKNYEGTGKIKLGSQDLKRIWKQNEFQKAGGWLFGRIYDAEGFL